MSARARPLLGIDTGSPSSSPASRPQSHNRSTF